MRGSRTPFLCLLIAASTTFAFAVDQPFVVQAGHSQPARPLPFFYDLYTFRGRDGGTAIVTAFAVESGQLESEAVADSVQYRFSVSFVLADTALRSVTGTHDTVFVAVSERMPDEHLLYTHVEVVAPPSTTTRQRVIMTDATRPGIGQLYTDVFPIPDYSGSELMLSDIALGQPDANAGWTRGDVTLALLPTSQFPSSAFDVYYEIYNLAAGTEYATEITISSADADEAEQDTPRPVTLRFNGIAGKPGAGSRSSAGLPELRRVDTSLDRGRHRIDVRITNLTNGDTALRSRHFEVRGWERGMTMVAATRVTGSEE